MSGGYAADENVLFWPRQDVVVDDFAAAGYVLDIGEGVIGQLKGAQVVAIDRQRRELEEPAARHW